jgi:hypothetical protein
MLRLNYSELICQNPLKLRQQGRTRLANQIVEINNISVQLDEGEVWNCLGSRDRVVPALRDELLEMITLGLDLCEAKALQSRLDIESVGRGKVVFETGLTLENPFLAHLFTGAKQAEFVLVTIGSALDDRVAELTIQGDNVGAIVLDAVGSALVMNVFSQLLTRILEETQSRDWDVGTCLRPGQSYWDITGQQSVFQVVPGERIGIQLLESAFMKPQKSQSAVVPLGPELRVNGDPNESYCRYCQAKNCPMRLEEQVELKV